MRLIDIDAWKNKNEAFIGLGLELDIDRVVETLNHMPTVEAIPIEYLFKELKQCKVSTVVEVGAIIDKWVKENDREEISER